MKTIGYLDRTEGKTIKAFYKNEDNTIFRQKKNDRIQEALRELKCVGRIEIYFLKGNKQRLIAIKN